MYNSAFMYLLIFMFFVGFLSFCFNHFHLLLTLLSLEYLVICVFFLMIFYIMNVYGEMYMILVYLAFSVCEGVLGLSILISMIRIYGNDLVNSLSIC